MTAASLLRDDFDAPALRRLARQPRAAGQTRRWTTPRARYCRSFSPGKKAQRRYFYKPKASEKVDKDKLTQAGRALRQSYRHLTVASNHASATGTIGRIVSV